MNPAEIFWVPYLWEDFAGWVPNEWQNGERQPRWLLEEFVGEKRRYLYAPVTSYLLEKLKVLEIPEWSNKNLCVFLR